MLNITAINLLVVSDNQNNIHLAPLQIKMSDQSCTGPSFALVTLSFCNVLILKLTMQT